MRICNTSMADEELLQLALLVGYQLSTSIDGENAIAEHKAYQTKRNLAIWHNHSTILQTGCILFAVWIVYDPIVFLTEKECTCQTSKSVSNLQEIIKEPLIYMIAPSSSSPDEQLALVPNRVECLGQPIETNRDKSI